MSSEFAPLISSESLYRVYPLNNILRFDLGDSLRSIERIVHFSTDDDFTDIEKKSSR